LTTFGQQFYHFWPLLFFFRHLQGIFDYGTHLVKPYLSMGLSGQDIFVKWQLKII
jgi:hypothetical protein